ncbi:helix-turn-helix domain-containing protein [Victivallis vadensis]|mgnify:FL=1|uniref:helix-turn-helix domain-containing protein n=1 Tax=Victivallis vadensis TaxID=172901 RepID=UPI000D7AD10F|nr:helix-turn-helix domain-containing protein [Victivallis vadensis]PWM80341.1 MAG: hypothetical protein DBX90_08625 [Lentisphaerota bacterium]
MIRTPEHLRELLQKLDDLAAVAGVGFRWKVNGAMLLPEPDLPLRTGYHDGESFCTAVKRLPGGESGCVCNDSREIAARLRSGDGPFVKRCHAGAVEVILPIAAGRGKAPGVVMAGPFREPGGNCRFPELEEEFRQLPELSREALAGYIRLIPPLLREPVRRAYLEGAGILPVYPADERIAGLLEKVRENPLLTPDELADGLFLSKSRLFHLFHAECRIGLGEYLLKLRLREARRMLLYGDWPISRIAVRTGFADQSHFTALFRREFGLPPRKYRREFGRAPA